VTTCQTEKELFAVNRSVKPNPMPPSHHLSREGSKNSINLFSHSLIHSCDTNHVALSISIITSHCVSTHT